MFCSRSIIIIMMKKTALRKTKKEEKQKRLSCESYISTNMHFVSENI